METQNLLTTIRNRKFDENICFLCCELLTEENRTDEHVIPKWLQNRFSLWNQTIVLLNNTRIPYRQLTIPCCFICNNNFLKPIEDEISIATQKGYDAFVQLDRHTVFIWLGKIFYGLLYKELFLKSDRRSESEETIADKNLLEKFQLHHYFLQCARVPMWFENSVPASIGIFPTKEHGDQKFNWDFRDNVNGMFISCRVGNVGIVATLQDGGALNHMFGMMDEIRQVELHPLQFQEVVAQSLYKSSLFNRTPKFLINEETNWITQSPLQGLSSKPMYDDWNDEHYAITLSIVTGVPIEKIFVPPDKVMTWLFDEDNKIQDISFDDVSPVID